MSRPLIPPRGVFIPSQLLYDKSLSPVIRDTYFQLLGLAYGKTETPPLSHSQLSEITGKAISTLRGHLAILRDRDALRWRTAQDSSIIISFPKGVTKGQAFFTEGRADSENLEKPVKEEEEVISSKLNLDLLPPPPDSSQHGSKKRKTSLLSRAIRHALLEAGVFENKLSELMEVGLSDAEILAILRRGQEEFKGQKKGALIFYRIKNKILPSEAYFGEPCPECGCFGSHKSTCEKGIREKYAVGGDENEIDEDASSSREEMALDFSESSNVKNSKAIMAWRTILGELEMEMPRASFNTWVRDAVPVALDDFLLIVSVRNMVTRDWLEGHLSSTVSRLLVGILNDADAQVEFILGE